MGNQFKKIKMKSIILGALLAVTLLGEVLGDENCRSGLKVDSYLDDKCTKVDPNSPTNYANDSDIRAMNAGTCFSIGGSSMRMFCESNGVTQSLYPNSHCNDPVDYANKIEFNVCTKQDEIYVKM